MLHTGFVLLDITDMRRISVETRPFQSVTYVTNALTFGLIVVLETTCAKRQQHNKMLTRSHSFSANHPHNRAREVN